MNNSDPKILLKALRREKTDRIPFWFMRQAGRYLPEYRELRSKAMNFLDFCYNPEMAREATLQPIRRFGMDGAILFSDILVVPHALGMDVRFEENIGPVLTPVQGKDGLKILNCKTMGKKLTPVYEAIRQTKKELPKQTTFLGFAGSPWTLACYMVQGKSDQNFGRVRDMAEEQPDFFNELLSIITASVTEHVCNQIEAGVEAIQLFDSWSGVLNQEQFSAWVIEPTGEIVSAVTKRYPEIPIIGFPRQSGSKYKDYAQKTGVHAVNIDSSVPLEWAKKELQDKCSVQGNLDPAVLAGNKEEMINQAKEIILALGDKPFVFNLGHGILPHTPVDHVQALCDFIKNSAIRA